MLKMFTTQVSGLFKRIMDSEDMQMEDGARLLAQAKAGQGTLYIKGVGEMQAVVFEAIEGAEPLDGVKPLVDAAALTSADRVLLLTRYSDDADGLALGKELERQDIPFVAVCGCRKEELESIADYADVVIDTKLLKPLLPSEDGNRVGFPSSMAGLYVYFALKFTIEEILEEFEEELQ